MYSKIQEQIDALEEAKILANNKLLELRQKMSVGTPMTALPPHRMDGSSTIGNHFISLADGKRVPVVRSHERVEGLYPRTKDDADFSFSDFVRGNMGLSTEIKNAASSTAVVPLFIGSQVIDLVRAKTVCSQAGADTIVIQGPTNFARITGDPTVTQHTEGSSDVSPTDVTFTPVAFAPKTLVCNIPLTMEVVQDSPNLDAVLRTAISGAFASKLDILLLTKILADANIPVNATGMDPNAWVPVLSAIAVACNATNKQDLPKAMISAPADFLARGGELASTAGSWLGRPPILEGLNDLFTSSMTAGTALFGDFSLGICIAVRQDLSLEMVRFGTPASVSHNLICTMRADGYVLQPARLFKQLKTVS